MKLIITIDMDNAAFETPADEVRRILKRVITDVRAEPTEPLNWPGPLFDSNGNTVGSLAIKLEEEDHINQHHHPKEPDQFSRCLGCGMSRWKCLCSHD